VPDAGRETRLETRLERAAPFWIGAALAVAASGTVSAISAFAPSYLASWSAAYLALVLGFAQAVIGTARVLLPARPPKPGTVVVEALAFDAAGLAVLLGTAVNRPAVTTAGAVVLMGVLAIWAYTERRSVRGGPWRWAFWAMVSVLAVSAPVGVVLAWWG